MTAASADISWIKALISRFSRCWNLLFILPNTSTSWTEHCHSGMGRRSPSLVAVRLMGHTLGKLLKIT